MTWTTRPRSKLKSGLSYFQAGRGPLVLLVHGVGLRAESWNPIFDQLSQSFEVLAIDLPGHGFSDNAPEDITTVGAITDFIKLSLGRKPDFIAGHSLGALVTMDWASRFNSGLRAVVALNTIFERPAKASEEVKARAESLADRTEIDPRVTLNRWFDDVDSPERAACFDWLTSNRIDQYAQFYKIFAHCDGVDPISAANFEQPALFLTGKNEPNSTPAMSERLASLVGNGKSYIVEDAAHMAPMTHSKIVGSEIANFFIHHSGDV